MRWVEVFAITPMGVPSVVLALALFLIYVMTPIHGSIWVLIIAHIIAHLPFTTRVLSAALLQLHKELEEAAHVTGATTARTLRTVTVPLILPALVNGWLWAFSATLRDFTFAIFLMTSRNMVLPSAMWVLWNVPDISGTAALGTLYMCGFVFVTIAARYVDQRQRKRAGWEVG
jgi:iron(III) transport system permease protein